ncbi:MAG: zinc-binding dehydrogenase, partial [Acidimicrobiia bacterium]
GLDIDDEKLAMVSELGGRPVRSDDFSSVDPASLFEAGRPTVVVDLVGTGDSLAWSSGALASGGRMVVLTTFRNSSLQVDPRDLVFRETSLVGSRYANRSEVAVAGGLVASGAVRPIIGQVAGPGDVNDLHDRLLAGTMLGRGALDWSEHAE